MIDEKEELITNILNKLLNMLNIQQINKIKEILIIEMKDIEIKYKEKSLIVSGDETSQVIKKFIACKKLAGLTDRSLKAACGGGGLILAYLKILKDNNINYQKRVKIIAQDLDFRSVYMTYIQLSLVGARAKVVQGDTLTKPDIKDENCIFYTPMWKGLL